MRWVAPVPPLGVEPDDWADMLTVAATVLGEAEGEPLTGKRAVAYVILNRAKDKRWPDTPGEVCLQHLQFSCWNIGSPRIPVMMKPQAHVTEQLWNDCFRATVEAFYGIEPDPSGSANHYLAPRSLTQLPSWARADKQTAVIDRHCFYRL